MKIKKDVETSTVESEEKYFDLKTNHSFFKLYIFFKINHFIGNLPSELLFEISTSCVITKEPIVIISLGRTNVWVRLDIRLQ